MRQGTTVVQDAVTVSFRIPAKLKRACEREAKERGLTVSSFVRIALQSALSEVKR
jgi:antitoxin component of RelBE/YafQ-DinJ toxin-antitoxin module